MRSYRFRRAAHRLITSLVMVMVLVTTFWSGWSTPPTQAAPASDVPQHAPNTASSLGPPSADAAAPPASLSPTTELAPLDALVLATPGSADRLARAIRSAGGYVYVQQDGALFAGLNGLREDELIPAGAQAVYQQRVSESDLASLSAAARDAAVIWNGMAGGRASNSVPTIEGGIASQLLLQGSPAPTVDSVYMVGTIGVKVVFVESAGTGTTENWTEAEINKVKTELVQAFDWWTNVATVPENPGEPPRPSANLVWNLSYISPFEGTTTERVNIVVNNIEPITQTIAQAVYDDPANVNDGWMFKVAGALTSTAPSEDAVRTMAHALRGPVNDWGFVIFVVDSSADTNGLFNDDLSAAAALNGPYVVISYDGGGLGVDNLEVLLAKMTGHVFGAGEEGYNSATGKCSVLEVYGYLRIHNTNCDVDPAASPSLMRSGQNMIAGYYGNALSEEARQMVGWRESDADDDDLYDVLDTLDDTFAGYPNDPACPILHLGDVAITNVTALPEDFGSGNSSGWAAYVRDTSTTPATMVQRPTYVPTNINRPGAVWGRMNGGEWVAGTASDGVFDEQDEEYSFHLDNILTALPGANQLEITVLNRWGQDGRLADTGPVNVTVLPPANIHYPAVTYESNDTDVVNYFSDTGAYMQGWTESSPPSASYSGNSTLIAGGVDAVNSEACFAFEGSEVTLLYSQQSVGKIKVLVDGEVHSIINVTNTGGTKAEHVITNLIDGEHTVQLRVAEGTVDFDAFRITENFNEASQVINAGPGGDIPPGNLGFYESNQPKIKYLGNWMVKNPLFVIPPTPPRPGTFDNIAHSSSQVHDRFFVYFTGADTIAIYRRVYPGGGTADVYVNGSLRGTMSNDAKVERVVPFYIGGFDPVLTHTVEVSVNSGQFDLDTVRFLNALTDTTNLTLWKLDAPGAPLDVPYKWTPQEITGLWEDKTTYRQSRETGSLQTVFFKGTAVGVNVGTDGSGGILELYVDGQLVRTVSLKASSANDKPIVLHGYDPDLPHVLQVRQVNQVPTSPKYTRIYGYTVYYGDPVGPGTYEEYNYDALGKPTTSAWVYEQNWATPKKITSVPGPSGTRFIDSVHDQARAYLYFSGADSLTFFGTAGGYGAIDFYINGQFKGTFVEKGSTTYNVPFTLTGFSSSATNVLEVRINTSLKLTKKVSIDRVVLFNQPLLGPGTYENDATLMVEGTTAPALQFSGQWVNVANVTASGGTFHMMKSINDEVIFNVRDTRSIVIYRRLYNKYGMVDVYVDNKLHSSFDNYVSTPSNGVFQQPYQISGLDPGFNHQIRLVPQRSGKTLTSFKPFDVDRIELRDTDTPGADYLEAGRYENDDPTVFGKAITYVGSWVHGGASTATYKGDKAQVVFYGNAFRIYFNRMSSGGTANIYIDGKLYGTFKNGLSPYVTDVPFTVVGLEDKMHTAQVVAQGPRVAINAFEVWSYTPYPVGTYDLAPTYNPYVLQSGLWTISGESISTKDEKASLYFFLFGGDTLTIEYDTPDTSGDIEVYVDGVLHSFIDASYIKALTGTTSTYLVSSLADILDDSDGTWVEIRNPKARTISLRSVTVGYMTNPLGPGGSYEAEDLLVAKTSGWWTRKPSLAAPAGRYSGNFYFESKNRYAHFYIPVQGVSSVAVYRPLSGSYNDVKVYVDGNLWGTMPMKGSTTQYSAPFSIGPLPNPADPHIIELRSSSTQVFALDKIEAYGIDGIGPGYYENSFIKFTGGPDPDNSSIIYEKLYSGSWKVITDTLASGGSLHQTTTRGARLTTVFTGNQITIYRRTSSGGKTMFVYIDGNRYEINNYAKVTTRLVPHTILLPNVGPHSFELVAEAGPLDFDALEIKNAVETFEGAYQHNSIYTVLNNTWTDVTSSAHSAGTYASTNVKYASAFFLFYGSRVSVYSTRGRTMGILAVYIDGKFQGNLDQYLYDKVLHPVPEPYYVYDIPDLTEDKHVLELRYIGTKHKSAASPLTVNLDAITVDGYPAPLPGEPAQPEEPGGGGSVIVPTTGCYEEYNFTLNYGPSETSWTLPGNNEASGQRYLRGRGQEPGEPVYAEIAFKATGFTLVYVKTPYGGFAEISVDGNPVTQLDMYDPNWIWWGSGTAVQYTLSGLNPAVNHVLRVKWLGTTSGTSTNVYIDRIHFPSYTTECIPGP
jgi:hypothetical protein